MKRKNDPWKNRAFVFAFIVLTVLCWCPLGYGKYGPVERFFGIPSWAVLALALSALLFIVEWIYLFHSHLAMNDEELPRIISELETVDTDTTVLTKEDR